jgi:hypothetical protein
MLSRSKPKETRGQLEARLNYEARNYVAKEMLANHDRYDRLPARAPSSPVNGLDGVSQQELSENARKHSRPPPRSNSRITKVKTSEATSEATQAAPTSWFENIGNGLYGVGSNTVGAATKVGATVGATVGDIAYTTIDQLRATGEQATGLGLLGNKCPDGKTPVNISSGPGHFNCVDKHSTASHVRSAIDKNSLLRKGLGGSRKYKSNNKSKKRQSKKKKGGKRKSKKNRKSKKRI